jgi:radical SAM superfamily enzyme YgiQ (UPF0313 family)
MRILIAQPPTNPKVWGGDFVFVIEPLWGEYLVAAVEKDHDVRFLDLRLEGGVPTFEKVVAEWQPDLVASTAYVVDINTVKHMFSRAKELCPKVTTVVGGYAASLSPGDLGGPSVDWIITGEGVFTFRELVETLDRGGDIHQVPGVNYMQDGLLRRGKARPWPELDQHPLPQRKATAGVRHNYFDKWMKPTAMIRSSYSCPFRCEFCVLWPNTDGKYLVRSIEQFVQELATIQEPYIMFSDDEALIQSDRMLKMADAIEKAGIKKQYFFMTRSDSVRRRPDVIERWAQIGLKRVLIGFESPRPRDLQEYNKAASVEDNDECIRILHQNNLEINSMFVIDQDYQKGDFEYLADYVHKNGLETPIYCILTPYPGTVTYEKHKFDVIVKDWDYWDLLHTVLPTKMPIRDFYLEYSKLWGDLPALERGILKHRDELPAEEVVANLRKLLATTRTQMPAGQ